VIERRKEEGSGQRAEGRVGLLIQKLLSDQEYGSL
jgi:hypothetical protein